MTRILRKQKVVVGELSGPERDRIRDDLVDIVLERFVGPPREVVAERVIFRDPAAQLCLFYGRQDRILGFTSLGIRIYEVRGQQRGVFDAGAYFRAGTAAPGLSAFGPAFTAACRFKLRHPRSPLCFIGEATGPAAYARATTMFRAVLPRRGHEPDDLTTELVEEVMRERGYLVVEGDPWRVRVGVPFGFRDEARIQRFVQRSRDEHVAYFVSRNPGYLAGQWLVVYVPLGGLDLALSFATLLRRGRADREPTPRSAAL